MRVAPKSRVASSCRPPSIEPEPSSVRALPVGSSIAACAEMARLRILERRQLVFRGERDVAEVTVRRALAKVGVVVRADEDRLVIALHGHALVVAEVERGVEVLDETVGRAAADVGERDRDADFEIPSEAAMRVDRGAMRLAVDEKDRRSGIHADDAEGLVAACAGRYRRRGCG